MSFPDIADSFVPRLPGSGPFLPVAGAGVGALTRAKFVDPDTTTPLVDQVGSDAAPFATIAQAVEALVLVGGGVVLCAPAQYPVEDVTPSTPVPLTLRGLSYADAGQCDLTNVNLNNKEAVALIDLFAFGNCTYRNALYVNNSNASQLVFDGESPSGNATLINSTAQQVECNTGKADNCSLQFFFLTDSCFLERTDVSVQLICGGNLIANGLVGQNSIPNGTTCDLTITANGYTLTDFTCFRVQQLSACLIVGTLTVVSPEPGQPIRNCDFANNVVLAGPAGSGFELDSYSYASFQRANGTLSGGAVMTVLEGQATARVSVVVPVLATDEMDFATVSVAGTVLEGLQPNTPICVTTTQDLSAAGAGRGGVLAGARVSAVNTVKIPFAGALAGGASDMLITKLAEDVGP